MSENADFLVLQVADSAIPWQRPGTAETALCEREGWERRQIPATSRGRPVVIEAMCNGQLAVNMMIEDEGFTIALARSGYRLSYNGDVFGRCEDAMRAAEAMMAEHSDWESVETRRSYDDVQRRVMTNIVKAAERRGEILLDRTYCHGS